MRALKVRPEGVVVVADLLAPRSGPSGPSGGVLPATAGHVGDVPRDLGWVAAPQVPLEPIQGMVGQEYGAGGVKASDVPLGVVDQAAPAGVT